MGTKMLELMLLLFFLLSCCNLSLVPSTDDTHHPVFSTQQGKIQGTRRTLHLNFPGVTDSIPVVDEILGIPYAAPPVGERRFKEPTEPQTWSGVRDGTKHSWVCPQSSTENATGIDLQSEDCLYLNVYSPYEPSAPDKLYPVMLFIHGGSYFYGSGNRYNGSALTQFGVVFVSINYRLGALGFMSSGSDVMAGNYGLLDQVEALKWVQKNIRNFRGDPNSVTIFGSSAGGASVGLLLLSPITDGLFHQVIAQSGTANAMWATHADDLALRYNVATFARAHNCYENDERERLKCLRKIPYDKFRAAHVYRILKSTEVDPLFKPRIDGKILPSSPMEILNSRSFRSVPYMTGTVRAEFGDYYGDDFPRQMLEDEVDGFLNQRYKTIPAVINTIKFEYYKWDKYREKMGDTKYYLEQYNRAMVLSDLGLLAPTADMADILASKPGQKVYLYYIDNYISFHSVELNHIFGVPWIGGHVDELGIWKKMDSDIDKQRSITFMQLWTNFAKYSNPTPDLETSPIGSIWRPTPTLNIQYLTVSATKTETKYIMQPHLFAHRVALWNFLIPQMVKNSENLSQGGLDFSDSKTWIFFGFTVAFLALVITLLCICVIANRRAAEPV